MKIAQQTRNLFCLTVAGIVFLLSMITGSEAVGQTQTSRKQHKLQVVTSTPYLAELVRELAEPITSTESLVDSIIKFNSTTPTREQLQKISSADLVFYHGQGLETGLDNVLKALSKAGVAYSVSSVTPEEQLLPASKFNRAAHKHSNLNISLWSSPNRWQAVAEFVAAELIARKPRHEELIKGKLMELTDELEDLDIWARKKLYKIPKDMRKLITDPDHFAYFAYDYGFELIPFRFDQRKDIKVAMQQFFPRIFLFNLSFSKSSILLDQRVDEKSVAKLNNSLQRYDLSLKSHAKLMLYSMRLKDGTPLSYAQTFKRNVNSIVDLLAPEGV